jgi:hypothetical protein
MYGGTAGSHGAALMALATADTTSVTLWAGLTMLLKLPISRFVSLPTSTPVPHDRGAAVNVLNVNQVALGEMSVIMFGKGQAYKTNAITRYP